MSTGIQWTDETWNPIRAVVRGELGSTLVGWHCEKVSAGCTHCYAEVINEKRFGTGLKYGRQSRDRVEILLDEKTLTQPLRWRKPRKVFVCSMTDLFGEWVTDEMLDRVWAVMALTPHITYQVLTKRPERMRAYLTDDEWGYESRADAIGEAMEAMTGRPVSGDPADDDYDALPWPLPNVWLMTSVEDQAAADARIPELLATPAAVRGLSCEPLLGPVHLMHHWLPNPNLGGPTIDWVIVGGESGTGARPCDLAWIRGVVAQCRAAGVAVFCKQLGANVRSTNDAGFDGDTPTSWPAGTQHNVAAGYQGAPLRVYLKSRKGADPAEWPEDLWVREFPR